MAPADVEAAAAVMAAGGWANRQRFLHWVVANPVTTPLVGLLDGRIVATGMGALNPAVSSARHDDGSTGWVGTIFVDKDLRCRGLGQEISEAVCERLEAAGCRTIVLMASDLGHPVYLKIGFRVDAWWEIWEAPALEEGAPLPEPPAGSILRPISEADIDSICALDRMATGEDRRGILAPLASRGWLVAGEDPGSVRGFLISIQPHNGALVAADTASGLCLLDVLRREAAGKVANASAAILRGDVARAAELQRLGYTRSFETARMVRGPSIDWQPEMIWNHLSFAFG
jgi:GNAT superfamily N-acetyltransferase